MAAAPAKIAASASDDHAAKKSAASPLKPAEETAAAQAKPAVSASAQAAAELPANTAAKGSSTTPAAPATALPFTHEAGADPSLHVSLLPQAAHVRMDVEGSGELDLHLRLRDGVAHVTVSGSAASLVESHTSDLRSALAGQGVALGTVEQVAPAHPSQSGAAGQELSQDGAQAGQRDRDERDAQRGQPAPQAAQRDSSAFTITRSNASSQPPASSPAGARRSDS